MKTWKEMFSDLFSAPPPITENSTLHEIAMHYPNLHAFIERKYGIKIADNSQSLRELAESNGLPPAQILFMEIQLESRALKVKEVSAPEVQKRIQQYKILDAREGWELKFGNLPGAKPLDAALLDEILNQWKKEAPLLVYCHFGIRSMDAATFFADHGFSDVSVLRGGIEAWSKQVDPSIPTYEGSYC
jgi:rhodanese-related sulfurtransferase